MLVHCWDQASETFNETLITEGSQQQAVFTSLFRNYDIYNNDGVTNAACSHLSALALHSMLQASTATIDASAGFNGTNEAHDQGRVVALALHRFDMLALQVAHTLRNQRNGMKLVVKAKLVQLVPYTSTAFRTIPMGLCLTSRPKVC